MSRAVILRTIFFVLSSIGLGLALMFFSSALLRPEDAPSWFMWAALVCLVVGFAAFAYRTLRLMPFDLPEKDKRLLSVIAGWFFYPGMILTLISMIAIMTVGPFVAAFWPDAKLNLPPLTANILSAVIAIYFWAVFSSWYDTMVLHNYHPAFAAAKKPPSA